MYANRLLYTCMLHDFLHKITTYTTTTHRRNGTQIYAYEHVYTYRANHDINLSDLI